MALRHLAAVALVVALAACSSSDDPQLADEPRSTTTSTTSTTTTSPDAPLGDCPSRPSGSSPAVFDDAAGTYAVRSLDVTDDEELRFDVVQWLSGDDADEAYEAETGDSSGVPNDYFVLNESDAIREAPLAPDAVLRRLVSDGGGGLVALDRADLAAHLATSGQDTWWLTFEDGAVTEVCQQYRP